MNVKTLLAGAVIGVVVGTAAMAVLMSGVDQVGADCPGEPGTPCGNGDADGNGRIQINDAVRILMYLFMEGPEPVAVTCVGGSVPATGQTISHSDGDDGSHQAGCPIEGRFVDNGDGTVTDACTGLMWQQDTADTDGDGGIDEDDQLSWEQALQHCENLELAGYTDWRLPNVRELQSIVDYGRDYPAIAPAFGAELEWYWSSSYVVSSPGSAWIVLFISGVQDGHGKGGHFYVRAVRGGL